MLCYRCGSHVPDGSETCGACGQKFASGSLRQTTGTFSRKKIGGQRLEGAPFSDGDVLNDRYVIKHGIGSGPLGFVFKAHDREIDVEVALKVISPRLLQTADERRGLAREVRLARKLSHNNIVRVYEDGEEKDHPFFTMQYLDGLTLRRIIDLRREKNQTFALAEVEPILAQIAAGLEAAHKLGPHGNVKPENVIVLPDLLKLTDFGIALGIPRQPFGAAQRPRGGHRYLAPEYLANQDVDRRADIYAMGVLLGEMTAGVFPDGASTVELRSRNPELPPALDGLYRKAINDNAQMRHATPADFMAELSSIVAAAEKAKPPPLRKAAPPPPAPPAARPPPPVAEPVRAEPARRPPPPPDAPPRRKNEAAARPPPPPPPVEEPAAPKPVRNGKPPAATQTVPREELPTPRTRRPAADKKKSSTWIIALAVLGVVAGAGSGYAYLSLQKPAETVQPKQTRPSERAVADNAGGTDAAVEPATPGNDLDLANNGAQGTRPELKVQEPRPELKVQDPRDAAARAEAERKKAEEEKARAEEERKRKEALAKAFEAKTEEKKPVDPAVAVVAATRSGCPAGMKLIPAGGFRMGSSRDDPMMGFDEKPLSTVEVAAYCIDVYEYPNRAGAMPVTNVSFAAAESMCKSRNKRLCTEEEWEKACKGSANARFPYGNNFDAESCNTEDAEGEDRAVAASGSFKACRSGYGIFDMSGNVAEWTASRYNAELPDRAYKGGSADRPDYDTRCASRKNGGPGTKKEQLGFRCCADPG